MGFLHTHFELANYRGAMEFHQCPHCRKDTFRRYVYKATGVEVNKEVGVCSNEKRCGYYYNPFDYLKDYNLLGTPLGESKGPSFIPYARMERSFHDYENNNFFKFLKCSFGEDKAFSLIKMYNVGTAKQKWEGASIFWQVDKKNKVRTGRIVLIKEETGRMIVDVVPRFIYVHHKINDLKFNPIECLFGEHLLRSDLEKEVLVVKEESAAIIGAGHFPNYLWVSTCGRQNPTTEMCRALDGRKTNWYPEGDSKFHSLEIGSK